MKKLTKRNKSLTGNTVQAYLACDSMSYCTPQCTGTPNMATANLAALWQKLQG